MVDDLLVCEQEENVLPCDQRVGSREAIFAASYPESL